MASSSLRHLTYKTVFLVASARRRSCLHLFSMAECHMHLDTHRVRLKRDPTFLPKKKNWTSYQGTFFFPKMSSAREDRLWCTHCTVREVWYIEGTKASCASSELFILPDAPHFPASKETVSRLLVQLIQTHAAKGERLRAHDLREQASFKALFAGVPMEQMF